MIKSTAKSEQFRDRSGNDSTKGSRKGFGLLGGGDDPVSHLSLKEQHDSLVAHRRYLEAQVATADGDERVDLCRQKTMIEWQMSDISKKIRRSQNTSIPDMFMDICREVLPREQFAAIQNEAYARQRVMKQKRGS